MYWRVGEYLSTESVKASFGDSYQTMCPENLSCSGLDQSADDIIPNVLKITVCSQRSEAGKLHVTGNEGAFGSLRQYLYLAGMSSSNYPGSPKENYILLDADLKLFGPEAEGYEHFGVSMPHSSYAQRSVGRAISVEDMQPGDIVCYSGHVGIYAGNGQIVNASNSKPYPAGGIKYTNAGYRTIVAVRRIF